MNTADSNISDKVAKWVDNMVKVRGADLYKRDVQFNFIMSQISRCQEYLRNNIIKNDDNEAKRIRWLVEKNQKYFFIENENDMDELVMILRAAKKIRELDDSFNFMFELELSLYDLNRDTPC